MKILSASENLDSVTTTAALLNEPPPSGFRYFLPVLGAGLTSLWEPEDTELFRRFLRELVGEWMACGKKIMPEDARVDASGMGPVQGYSERWHWTLCLIPKSGYEDGSMVRGKELDTSEYSYNSWLWRVYWDFLHRVQPNVWFLSDGQVLFNYATPAYSDPGPPIALPPFLSPDSPDLKQWMEAVLWFMLLLNSGYAQLLDRCAFCQKFFVRKREIKSGHVYKRGGANCGNCKGESSKVRTSDIRIAAKGKMLHVAAVAHAAWKRTYRTPDRYSFVADRVNARCPDEVYVTTRKDKIEPLWVKRNEREVVQRAERIAAEKGEQQNAKG